MHKHTISLFLALLMPLLGACVGGTSETQSTSNGESSTSGTGSSSSDTSSSGDTETSSSTGSGSASDGSSTTDDGTSSTTDDTTTDGTTTDGTTTDGTTTDGTTTDGTTGGGSDAIAESCKAACGPLVECFPDFGTLEECTELCIEESTPLDPDLACEKAAVALNECLATATCQDFDDLDFCAAEDEAVDAACGGDDECIIGGGANMDGTECDFIEDCPGDYVHEFKCTQKTCMCIEDGETTMECPTQKNICAKFDPDLLEQLSFECCGW